MVIVANCVIALTVLTIVGIIINRPSVAVLFCLMDVGFGFTLALGVLGWLPEVSW